MSGDLARMHVLYQEGLQGMPPCWDSAHENALRIHILC